jgi:CspA family cold shock protein
MVFAFPGAHTILCPVTHAVEVIMGKQSGIVKWFSRLKGYGFIFPDEGEQEVFVHYSAIEGEGYRNLHEGERVEYDLVDKGKGPQAQNVKHQRSYTP